jgi:hypothetical protein
VYAVNYRKPEPSASHSDSAVNSGSAV